MIHYVRDPEKIERQTYAKIRELTTMDSFTADEKQVVIYMVRACGEPSLAEKIRFSPNAIEAGKKAIKNYAYILYDFEGIRGGLDTNLLYQEPMCFTNKSVVISQAKAKKQTRSMTAVDLWKPYVKGSIAIFGQSSTALCRLLEMLKAGEFAKPNLVVATPPSFINTEECKEVLVNSCNELGIEYILIEGRWGGSMFATAAVNALLNIQQDIYV
ncbi:MAG: precorrin-8X methylmutase [Proteobacteria bacterium]|nr:MAG: precorrin-8X methylmutase [Pseudomonadota bacterium]